MNRSLFPQLRRTLVTGSALILLAGGVELTAEVPVDNPVSAHYGPGEYPVWTDSINWGEVIDMSTYSNGATHFEKFENARDELHALGGGVLYYPAGTYVFDLPDTGYGPGIGPKSRGLMLKSGVVIRGEGPAPGEDQAVVRLSDNPAEPGFYDGVSYTLNPPTVFVFSTQTRGKHPVTMAENAAGEAPRDWNFIGMMPGDGEADISEVTNIGVVNVKLDGGFVFWGFHTPRSETLDTGTWFTNNWKSNWPAGAPLEDTWAKRVPDGTHYMDAIHGADGWDQPVYGGSGRLIFNVYSVNGAPFDDMSNLDFKSTEETELPADAFHSYRYTGRLTAHGTDIFIANNVLAKPTRNFVHRMQQRNTDKSRGEQVVLFDYSNHIGVDVNKSNFGGHQNDLTVVGPNTGYHFPNTVVRDNWIFNRGNKGMDIASQWMVLLNNHNERYHAANTFPYEYITNAGEAYPDATPESGINAGGISFDGWRWQASETASDYMSRGYDIGGRNIWVERNSVINAGSRGNDGEGIMAQRHNNIETYSWAFTHNTQNKVNLGPGTSGEDGWIGIYDMHAAGFLVWNNAGTGAHGILLALSPNNWVLDTTVGPNLLGGGSNTPGSVQFNDYQDIHSDPVNPPVDVTAVPLPENAGIQINWVDSADNELGFRIERRLDGGEWQTIAYRPAQNLGKDSEVTAPYSSGLAYPELNIESWIDYMAIPAMSPEYRVVAFNANDDASTGVSDSVLLEEVEIDVPVILTSIETGGAFRLSLQSVDGMSYQLQMSINLSDWSDVDDPVAGNGGLITIDRDAPSSGETIFYRVLVSP